MEQGQAPLWAPPPGARGSHLVSQLPGAAAAGLAPWPQGLAQLAAVCDDNLLGRLPALGAIGFYFLHNIHALFDVAKHNMFAIQPVRTGEPGGQKQEECNVSQHHGHCSWH